jgi:hypothetical protein
MFLKHINIKEPKKSPENKRSGFNKRIEKELVKKTNSNSKKII